MEHRDEEQLVRRAIEHRPELEALREEAYARGDAATARAGERWPRVFAVGNYEYGDPNSRIIPSVDAWKSAWDVSVVAEWSPTDALIHNSNYDRASAQLASARDALEQFEEQVRIEVTADFEQEVAARAALTAARVAVEAAEASYRGRLAQLRAGGAVTSNLLDADAELTAARLSLLNAAIDVRIAGARLRKAVGG